MGDNDLSDWDEIDDEIDSFTLSVASSSVVHSPAPVQQANVLSWEASSSCASSSNSKVLDQFIGMGFSKKLAEKAIEENGEDNTEAILETLLTYSKNEELHLKMRKRDERSLNPTWRRNPIKEEFNQELKKEKKNQEESRRSRLTRIGSLNQLRKGLIPCKFGFWNLPYFLAQLPTRIPDDLQRVRDRILYG